MKRPVVSLLVPAVVLAALLSLTACTVSPEKSPAYLKLSEKVKEILEKQESNQRSLETLYVEVDGLIDDLEKMKTDVKTLAAAGGSQKDVALAMQKVSALEEQVKVVTASLEANKKELTEAKSAVARIGKEAASRPARTVDSSSKTSVATASAPAPAKPSGFYYKVQQGDTLQSIAGKYDVTSADICRANRLPLSAAIYPGQSIYIPRG